jgi:hypothetical protein
MIRFPTHDGRGGFTLALSSHPAASDQESTVSRFNPVASQSRKSPSAKALSTHASTSSSILDDALPRQTHSSNPDSLRILAWAQEQQLYVRLRNKRRRLSTDPEQAISRQGFEGWLWQFVSRLIGMDEELLQIVLGEKFMDTPEKAGSDAPSLWEGFLQRSAMERHLSSPFLAPSFREYFRQNTYEAVPPPQSVTPTSRPMRPAPSPWDTTPRSRQLPQPKTSSSWSSFPPDPMHTVPFQPTPIRLTQPSARTESSHAPWGIEDNDILSTTTELPDDYWDRELTIPLVWHLVKNFISSRLPRRQTVEETVQTVRSCKEESVRGRWDEDFGDERYYWHESVDGASSLGLGLGGLGTWAEV